MNTRIRIVHWLRFLLLSAGLAAGPCGRSPDILFRRHRQKIFRKIKRKRIQKAQLITTLSMKLRIQILHWLSLHILSTDKSGELLATVSASWFHHQRATVFKLQTIPNTTNNKNIKTTIKY